MTTKTYTETNAVPYYDECDVLVVGSGCAGHSAAIAAARAGCKNIILMERYGYSGGDVTGAYVLMVPKLSWYNQTYVRGIQQEWFDRLKVIPGAVLGPEPEEVGSSDPVLVNLWGSYMGGCHPPQYHRQWPTTETMPTASTTWTSAWSMPSVMMPTS